MQNVRILCFIPFVPLFIWTGLRLIAKFPESWIAYVAGVLLTAIASLGGLSLVAYAYWRERYRNDRSAGIVSPLFAAVTLVLVGMLVMNAFLRAM